MCLIYLKPYFSVIAYDCVVKFIQTFVYNRFLLTEIREGGEFRNAILFREPLVVYFNKVDAKSVRIVIYLL